MKHTSLIDGNSLGRAAHSGAKLTTGSMETQAVFSFLRGMLDLKRSNPSTIPFVLWDGRAQWRFDLHPGYKSNRDNDPKKVAEAESYKRQKPFIQRALRHLGVRQMTAFSHEADDMAGYFVDRLASQPGNVIELVTGDKDWLQLIRPGVSWRDHRSDGIVDVNSFYHKTGCKSPFAFLETKALMGDSSDCIPGVGGIGEKGAPEFIAEFGSVREFWRRCDAGEFKPKLKKHVNLCSPEGRAIYRRNFRLMQLLRVPAPARDDIEVIQGQVNRDEFGKVCEELAFGSILRSLDNFIRHFQQ